MVNWQKMQQFTVQFWC